MIIIYDILSIKLLFWEESLKQNKSKLNCQYYYHLFWTLTVLWFSLQHCYSSCNWIWHPSLSLQGMLLLNPDLFLWFYPLLLYTDMLQPYLKCMIFIKFYFDFLKRFYFIFRQRGREGEREEETHQCVVASCMSYTGGLACNSGICPDWESNRWHFGLQACTQPLSHTVSGFVSGLNQGGEVRQPRD